MNGLQVPLHPSLRHEPLATEFAVVTLDPEVLLFAIQCGFILHRFTIVAIVWKFSSGVQIQDVHTRKYNFQEAP